jgi:transposase
MKASAPLDLSKLGSANDQGLGRKGAEMLARCDPEWRQHYFHLVLRRGRAIAKVALARKLAVRLFWMWRKGQDYQQGKKFGSDTGQLEVPNGVKSITVKVIERPAPSMA